MSPKFKQATTTTLILLATTLLIAVFSQAITVANAQDDTATVIIQPSMGGTTSPALGTYTYPNGTNIVLTATPSPGFTFLYWVASGNLTPGHIQGQTSTIADPNTGEVIAIFPRPSTSAIDSLVFTTNPATITCGYGYTYQYQAIFAAADGTVPTSNTAIVVVQPSVGGTTSPASGTYTYNTGTNITLMATPSSGYAFAYWIVSGNTTPTHSPGVPNYIIDPDTGETVGSIPKPPVVTAIDSLVFTTNPANITCGYGYTYQYQAVFMPLSTSPSPTATASPTPAATATPTSSPTATATPSPSPTETSGGLSTEVIVVIAVVVIVIIIAIAAMVMRRKK